jgi:uncharacterized protein (TIGR02118 family)
VIKLVTVLKRRMDLTREEFEWRWLNVHAPLAAVFPNLRGYILSFSVLEGESAADGVAQLWYDDRVDAQNSYATDVGREGSRDARNYLSRRDHLLVSERWAFPPTTDIPRCFKFMIGLKRPASQTRAEFAAGIEKLDSAMLKSGLRSDIIRLCCDEMGQQLNSGVDGVLKLQNSEAEFDGLIEAWYHDVSEMLEAEKAFETSELALILEHETNKCEHFLLKENVIVTPPEQIQPSQLVT